MNEGGVLDERFALAPDPELARVAWERVRDAGVELQSEDVIRLLGFSTAAGDFLVRHPDEGTAVGDPSGRDRAALENEVAADIERLGVVAGLRRFRRRAILRVAARDLAGAAVDDVVREISGVADACVQVACPPDLAVVALGKWGGCELNYASDIDLLLVHGADDPGSAQLVRTLSEQTEDGIAARCGIPLYASGAGRHRLSQPRKVDYGSASGWISLCA
jgi:glutamine synthetase adenylyltransferase